MKIELEGLEGFHWNFYENRILDVQYLTKVFFVLIQNLELCTGAEAS